MSDAVERATEDAALEALSAALAQRGLLLSGAQLDRLAVTMSAAGSRLLEHLLHECYSRLEGAAVEFEHDDGAERIGAALAFGAVCSAVLSSGQPTPGFVEFACAAFNLGIGLVDGICDGDPPTGERLLRHLRRADVAGAAASSRPPGWLRSGMPVALAADAGAAFAADVIEVFFRSLHRAYPDAPGLRHIIGEQLALALDAESRSLRSRAQPASPSELLECSRATSVLPFQIIETLTVGDEFAESPSAATLLGEAMWRIDDLVDLCEDARAGALNGILVAADRDGLTGLLASGEIDAAASRAADCLYAGLALADARGGTQREAFRYFVQRYAGIPPAEAS